MQLPFRQHACSSSPVSRSISVNKSRANNIPGASAAVAFNKMIFNNPGGTTAPSESEDCLYLNVFAPVQNTPQEAKKPVLFWIFGVCTPS
jgi:carboxylesterase type B